MTRRVLLVDDDVMVLEVIACMLADLGCDTVTARSGSAALGTIANDNTIEVLISDINMPGLAGSELAERARSYRPELAVILLTGGAADSRGFPLLRKPFAQSDLRRVMAERTNPAHAEVGFKVAHLPMSPTGAVGIPSHSASPNVTKVARPAGLEPATF